MILTRQQAYLKGLAEEKGFVTLGEAKIVYASSVHRRNALRTLVKLNILRPSERPNRFDLVTEDE